MRYRAEFLSLLLREAEKSRENAGFSGEMGAGGAGVLE